MWLRSGRHVRRSNQPWRFPQKSRSRRSRLRIARRSPCDQARDGRSLDLWRFEENGRRAAAAAPLLLDAACDVGRRRAPPLRDRRGAQGAGTGSRSSGRARDRCRRRSRTPMRLALGEPAHHPADHAPRRPAFDFVRRRRRQPSRPFAGGSPAMAQIFVRGGFDQTVQHRRLRSS